MSESARAFLRSAAKAKFLRASAQSCGTPFPYRYFSPFDAVLRSVAGWAGTARREGVGGEVVVSAAVFGEAEGAVFAATVPCKSAGNRDVVTGTEAADGCDVSVASLPDFNAA